MKLLQYFLILLALAFLGNALLNQWEVIKHLQWQVNLFLLSGALLSLVVLYFVDALGWHMILKSLGVDIHPKTSLTIWIFSSLSRYLPGVVWAYANRIIWANRYGVGTVRGSTSMLMENVLLAISSLLVGLPALATALNIKNNFLLLISLVVVMICSLHPSILSLFRLLPGKLGQKFSKIEYPPFSQILSLLLFYVVFWVAFSLVFVLFSASLFSLSPNHFLVLATAFSASFGIGFIMIIFPGGIGIREATLYTILTTILPDSTALILAIGSRIWLLTGEILTVALTALYFHRSKIKSSQDEIIDDA